MITKGEKEKFNYESKTIYLPRTLEEMKSDRCINYIFVGCDPDTMESGVLYQVEVDWPASRPIENGEPCSSEMYYNVVRGFKKVPQDIIDADELVRNYWLTPWQKEGEKKA